MLTSKVSAIQWDTKCGARWFLPWWINSRGGNNHCLSCHLGCVLHIIPLCFFDTEILKVHPDQECMPCYTAIWDIMLLKKIRITYLWTFHFSFSRTLILEIVWLCHWSMKTNLKGLIAFLLQFSYPFPSPISLFSSGCSGKWSLTIAMRILILFSLIKQTVSIIRNTVDPWTQQVLGSPPHPVENPCIT